MSTGALMPAALPPIPAAAFDLERYHKLSVEKKRTFTARTHRVIPARHLVTGLAYPIPVAFNIRIGIRIPNTNAYQVTGEHDAQFELRVEADALKAGLAITEATRALESEAQSPELVTADFCGHSLMHSIRPITLRTMSGKSLTTPGGFFFHVGEAQHLRGWTMLSVHLRNGAAPGAKMYFPVSSKLWRDQFVAGNIVYATGNLVATTPWQLDPPDFTVCDRFPPLSVEGSGEDFVACGEKCQGVQVSQCEEISQFVKSGVFPLAWYRNAAGEVFVKEYEQLTEVGQEWDFDIEAVIEEKGVADWPQDKFDDMTRAAETADHHPATWENEYHCGWCGGWFKQHRAGCIAGH